MPRSYPSRTLPSCKGLVAQRWKLRLGKLGAHWTHGFTLPALKVFDTLLELPYPLLSRGIPRHLHSGARNRLTEGWLHRRRTWGNRRRSRTEGLHPGGLRTERWLSIGVLAKCGRSAVRRITIARRNRSSGVPVVIPSISIGTPKPVARVHEIAKILRLYPRRRQQQESGKT